MSMGSAIGTEAEEKVDLKLNNKYLDEAEELIKRKDYVQAQPFKKALTEKASLKLWGAAAEMVKVVAAKRGVEIKSHGELYKFVAKLKTELGDPELSRLFGLAGALHQNFYENWLPPATVVDHAEAVKELVAKLKRAL